MNDDRFAPVCRFMVPQVVTALRLVFSSLAIVAAIRGGFDLAAKFIIFGIVTDSLDGPLARRLNVTTEFGALFDYYVDYACMVVAPSILAFLMTCEHIGNLSVVLITLPMLTGAVRYARNGIWLRKQSFEEVGYPGLGTVFFALFVVGLVLLDMEAIIGSAYFSMLLLTATPVFSAMMVAPWRYPKLTKFRAIHTIVCASMITMLFTLTEMIAAITLLVILTYAVVSPLVFRARV